MQRRHVLMKIWGVLAVAVLLLVALATPAFAQGEGGKFVLGEDYVLETNETLDGGLVVVGGSATVKKDARVNGDVFVSGGNVTISGVVNGSIAIWGGNLRLTRTAEVTGDVVTLGGEVLRDEGSQIGGNVTSNTSRLNFPRLPNVWGSFSPGGWNALSGIWDVARWVFNSFVSALVFGALAALVLLIADKPARQMQDALVHAPWASLGMGALTFVAALAVMIILTITLCLIPLALLLAVALAVAILVGWAVVSLWVSERVLVALKVNAVSPWLAAALGAAALALLSRIPGLGWLVGMAVGAAGLGALALTRAGTLPYPRPIVPYTPASTDVTPAAAPPQGGQDPDEPAI